MVSHKMRKRFLVQPQSCYFGIKPSEAPHNSKAIAPILEVGDSGFQAASKKAN
jgi:hypothetical protein